MASIFESNEYQHGERATESAHRKVELQSPADLSYLIANVQRTAREKIDRDLPPDATAEQEDAMRKKVEELVDDYIRDTFGAAKRSMSINGMDTKESEAELAKAQDGEEIENFDTRLAQRIQSLSSQIESHTLQLAVLRRTAPAETTKRFQDSFTSESERYDAQLRKDEARSLQEAKQTNVDVGEIQRLEEIQGSFKNGQESLLALKSGFGSTVAKLERAQQAVNVLEAE